MNNEQREQLIILLNNLRQKRDNINQYLDDLAIRREQIINNLNDERTNLQEERTQIINLINAIKENLE